jgi:hypothetical protein
VSKQALWERIHDGTEAFARSLLERLLVKQTCKRIKTSVFTAFTRVVIHDSTTLRLPDSLLAVFPGSTVNGVKTAIARIQSILELKTMRFINFSLGAYTQNDQGASSGILDFVAKGDLLIRDLGYFSMGVFQRLQEKQVSFLSRLFYGVKLYERSGRELRLKELLQKTKRVDRWVYIGKKSQLWVRLIMIPLPQKQAAERIRKARHDRDRRSNHSKQYYQWLRYNVFVTTVGKEIWSTAEVAAAYGVRWQIEMIFKSWKSGLRMQNLLHDQCQKYCRVKTNLYLLLLFICLFMQKVYMHYRQVVEQQLGKIVSLLKLATFFFTNMVELLICSPQKLKQQIAFYACYEQRNDRINMTEFINSF